MEQRWRLQSRGLYTAGTLGSQRCSHEFLSQTCSAHEELLHTQTFGVPGMGVGVEPPLYPPVERMRNVCHFASRGTLSDNGGHLTVVRIKCQF